MSTCFIFFDALNYTPDADLPAALWAMRLDDAGDIDVALSAHTMDAIQSMCAGLRTIIVLPGAVASIYRLDLPKLSMRKAREAMPYALEEMLAEPVQSVHVAFDKEVDDTGFYRAVVLNKLRLNSWIAALNALGIRFDAMTLDWFALKPEEICLTDTDMLVYDTQASGGVCGALSPSVAKPYLKTAVSNTSFLFDDSVADGDIARVLAAEKQAGSYRIWIAKRLQAIPFVNICQGQFQQKVQTKHYQYWGRICAGLLGALFLVMIFKNLFLLHQLHRKQAVTDEKIKAIYMRFFPEATQVISPRFRIEKLLATQGGSSEAPFWFLLDKLSQVYAKHPKALDTIESMVFNDQVLTVRLFTKNFESLEQLEQALTAQFVRVKQLEASSREHQVFAVLELQS